MSILNKLHRAVERFEVRTGRMAGFIYLTPQDYYDAAIEAPFELRSTAPVEGGSRLFGLTVRVTTEPRVAYAVDTAEVSCAVRDFWGTGERRFHFRLRWPGATRPISELWFEWSFCQLSYDRFREDAYREAATAVSEAFLRQIRDGVQPGGRLHSTTPGYLGPVLWNRRGDLTQALMAVIAQARQTAGAATQTINGAAGAISAAEIINRMNEAMRLMVNRRRISEWMAGSDFVSWDESPYIDNLWRETFTTDPSGRGPSSESEPRQQSPGSPSSGSGEPLGESAS